MSVSIGTSVGPVRVSKRLGGKKSQASASEVGEGIGYLILGACYLAVGSVALTVLAVWALLATELAVFFAFLAGIGFGISKFVPGAHAWGMRFAKAARWSWTSIPKLGRALFSRKLWSKR